MLLDAVNDPLELTNLVHHPQLAPTVAELSGLVKKCAADRVAQAAAAPR
jgi:hypothetical protein